MTNQQADMAQELKSLTQARSYNVPALLSEIEDLKNEKAELLKALELAFKHLVNQKGDDLAPPKIMNQIDEAIAKARGQ